MLTTEKEALKALMSDTDIVIKPADKGGSIVDQDVSAYVCEIDRQLGDTNAYMRLQTDPTMKFSEEIKLKLKKALSDSIITGDEYKYLIQTNPLRPVIYTPFIHLH